MQEIKVSEISYADGMVILISEDEKTLNENLKIYREALNKYNMNINRVKSKTR